MTTRRNLLAAVPTLATLASPRLARAQARPIRVIVPFAPGGQSDTVARLLQPKMAEFLGQSVVVENRSGAGGAIGAAVVATAPADGQTLLLDSFGFIVQPLVQRNLTFDYQTGFAPIAQAVELPYVLVVRSDFPARDLAGYIAAAKARPGTAYGTPGIGSIGHLAGALLAHRAGIALEHVPYRGGAEAARDIAAGNLDSAISTANSLRPIVVEGRAHGIALTSGERRGSLSQLPTIAESGFPGFDLTSWNGFFAPAATPAPVIDRLEAALRHATTDAQTRTRLEASGNDPVTGSAADFAERIRRDRETLRQLIRDTGLRLE
jgi:tripartite-type tricarboxylate transporter receptor subunit TctC